MRLFAAAASGGGSSVRVTESVGSSVRKQAKTKQKKHNNHKTDFEISILGTFFMIFQCNLYKNMISMNVRFFPFETRMILEHVLLAQPNY